MSKGSSDPRFSAMHTAPLFKKLRKEKFKTKVDDRFKKVLTDDRFSAVPSVDARGKKKKKNAKDDLRQFYDIEEDDEVDTSVPKEGKKSEKGQSMETRLDYLNKLARGEISDSSDSESDVASASDSDSSDAASISSEASYDPLHIPGDEPELAENVDNVKRLSIQNCDWDNVKALDLLVMLQSFCPTGGKVVSVTVYPSDFGLQRMKEEELHGPVGIWSKNKDAEEANEEQSEEGSDESDNDVSGGDSEDEVYDSDAFEHADGDGDFVRPSGVRGIVFSKQPLDSSKQKQKAEADNLALREYELSKLRYYFAIAEFDRSITADKVYAELDGIEFEHSSMALDFRYVPDDISFNEREVRDECHDMPAAGTYTPPEFIIQALQHTNVECTWDQGERSRQAKLTNSSLWKKLQDSDLQQYIASSDSEEDDEEVEKKRSNIRKLLLGDAADSDDMYGSDDHQEHDDFFMRDENEDAELDDTKLREEKDVDKVMSFLPKEKSAKSLDEETPAEARLRKKQERKAKKISKSAEPEGEDDVPQHRNMSAELELMFAGESDSENKDYDMRQIMKDAKDKKKKNKKKGKVAAASEDSFAIDLKDDRFSRLEQDPNFGIDPTSADYKHTKGMETLLESLHEKRERKRQRSEVPLQENGDTDAQQDVTSLADKLKKKFSNNKNKKAKV